MSEAKVRGKVVTAALDLVKPNGWNPNVLPEHKMRALERGMREEGWLASQPLLIWKTDKNGEKKNLIIDGEHRWLAARTVGMTQGPMVFLDGIAEAEAKALTIKIDNIRGQFDNDALGALLREIQPGIDDLELACGFDSAELAMLIPELIADSSDAGTGGASLLDRAHQEFGTETKKELFMPELKIKVSKELLSRWRSCEKKRGVEAPELLRLALDALDNARA